MSRGAIVELFRAFTEAAVEMTDRLVVFGVEGSEDTLDDLGDSLVVLGRRVYVGTYEGELPLPDRAEWEDLPTFAGVFGVVFHERFSAEIVDEI